MLVAVAAFSKLPYLAPIGPIVAWSIVGMLPFAALNAWLFKVSPANALMWNTVNTLVSIATVWFTVNVLAAPYSFQMQQDIERVRQFLR